VFKYILLFGIGFWLLIGLRRYINRKITGRDKDKTRRSGDKKKEMGKKNGDRPPLRLIKK